MLAAMKRNPDITATLPDAPSGLPAGSWPDSGSARHRCRRTVPARDLSVSPRGTTDIELLEQAHEALVRELDVGLGEPRSCGAAAQRRRTVDHGVHRAEGERLAAGAAENRRTVSASLRIGMRLQADPTVIYGLGATLRWHVAHRDLQTDGPYNTYTRVGLPPTPIALAGAAAIRATAHPENTDALYFVASTKGRRQPCILGDAGTAKRRGRGYVAHLRKGARRRPADERAEQAPSAS